MDKELNTWLYEFHKSAYVTQIERADKFRDRVSFISSLQVPLGGAIVYLASTFPHSPEGWATLFYLPMLLSGILFLMAIGLIFRSLAGRSTFANPPTPKQVQETAVAIEEFALATKDPNIDCVAELSKQLAERLCDAATHNLTINRRRSDWYLWSMRLSIASFICLIPAGALYSYAKSTKPDEPTRVIITQPIRTSR